jgi:hypothetical protein
MFVKVLDGRYAGEIREFAPAIAKNLIASGRAVNPYAEPEVAIPVAGTSHVGASKSAKKAASGKGSR